MNTTPQWNIIFSFHYCNMCDIWGRSKGWIQGEENIHVEGNKPSMQQEVKADLLKTWNKRAPT